MVLKAGDTLNKTECTSHPISNYCSEMMNCMETMRKVRQLQNKMEKWIGE